MWPPDVATGMAIQVGAEHEMKRNEWEQHRTNVMHHTHHALSRNNAPTALYPDQA